VPERLADTRENFALRESEHWRPPAFRAPRTAWDRLLAAARRALDLQAASAWNDLKIELAHAHGDVLDVGAGAQPYRPLLPTDARYKAIDIAAAREQFGYEVPDTEYFDGSTWPVANDSIDLVLATETLEHVLEPREFLAEARRVLRPGGCLLLTVPFAARWHYIPHDYWRYTPSSLKYLLEGTGFGDVIVHARGNETTVACYKAMALILAELFPHDGGFGPKRAGAALMLPLVAVAAAIGHASMRSDGGVDCLGWTVTAELPISPSTTVSAG
jgi:SAM-dependent methyltransferase